MSGGDKITVTEAAVAFCSKDSTGTLRAGKGVGGAVLHIALHPLQVTRSLLTSSAAKLQQGALITNPTSVTEASLNLKEVWSRTELLENIHIYKNLQNKGKSRGFQLFCDPAQMFALKAAPCLFHAEL